MQTPTLFRPKSNRGATRRPRPDDFRRLGLGPTEARVTVIRKAAKKLALPLAAQFDPACTDKAEAELALVLASTYRLLDPRRRNQLVERVQLLRAEPTPLRSHLLEPHYMEALTAGSSAASIANPTATSAGAFAAEGMAGEFGAGNQGEEGDDEPLEISEHDWMLECLAELRTEPPAWRRRGQKPSSATHAAQDATKSLGSQNAGRAKHDKHRTQMLEVARYLQSGNSRISRLTGILGGIGLLLAGIVVIAAFGWLSGNSKPLQADPVEVSPPPASDAAVPPAVDVERQAASDSSIRFEPSSQKYDDVQLTEADDLLPDDLLPGDLSSDTMLNEFPLDAAEDAQGSALKASDSDMKALGDQSLSPVIDAPAVLPLDSMLFSLPAESLDKPVLYPLPQQAALDEAVRKLRGAGMGRADGFPLGRSGVIEIWRQANAASAGSVDRLAIGVLAGRQAVLIGEEALAMAISEELSKQFAASRAQVASLILTDAVTDAVTQTELERVAMWGLRVSDDGLVRDYFDVANEAARIATGVAAKQSNAEIRARLKQRRDSIAIAQRMAATLEAQPLPTADGADRNAAWNHGRHLSINHRNWDVALPYLAAGNEIRFSALATEELRLRETSSANDIAAVARKWNELADRRKGREQDSLRLHAHQMLLLAASKAEVIGRLELEKEAQQLLETIPKDLHPLSLENAQRELNGTSASIQLPQDLDLGASKGQQAATLLGRLVVSGQDTGVVLRLPGGIAVPRAALDELLGRLAIAPGNVSIEFHGLIELNRPTTVSVTADGPALIQNPLNPSGVLLTLGNSQPSVPQAIPLTQNGGRYTATVDLPAGEHRLAWKVSGEQFGTLQLLLRDERDGQPLLVRHDQVTADLIRQLPVRLNVDFQAR